MLVGIEVYACSVGDVLISSSVPTFYGAPYPLLFSSYFTGVCSGGPVTFFNEFGLSANEGFAPILGFVAGLVKEFIFL